MKNGGMKQRHLSFIVHPSSFSSGFTLMEILLVVVIILIATGIAVPMFRGTFQTTQMQDAVRSTMRMSRYARSMSILKQKECTLLFSSSNLLQLTVGGTNDNETVSRRFPEDIRVSKFKNLAFESSELPEEDGQKVSYYPSGMNDGFEVTLSDENDRRVTVTCNPMTGKTVVEE